MEITCKHCNGKGKRSIQVGDIVTPQDGSGVPNGLHEIIFNGVGSDPPFSPVKVLHIEGNALFVLPIDCRGKTFDAGPYGARSWMEIGNGYWIFAPHCYLR